ncbi:hypothetical protein [Microbacterium soli]|uniref:Uncharacterized protein n=1 Tax=Microbacterium soli TaxID=446075 RepID=A0ABP7NIR7_9MICO
MSIRPLAVLSATAVALALTACTAPPTPAATSAPPPAEAAEVVTAPTPEVEPPPDPDSCDALGWTTAGTDQRLVGDVHDRGARALAAGAVGHDSEGRIVTYTVAAGDAPDAIGERLCIRNAGSLAELNHTRTIHPDQVLRIFHDPAVPVVPYYNPRDAEPGFAQIPYQQAIEAMGAAADAGDVATLRKIWQDTLSGMFVNADTRAQIQSEIDAGDVDVLRQMFS